MLHSKIGAALVICWSIALASPASASLTMESRDIATEAMAAAEPAQVSNRARPASRAKVVRVKRLVPEPGPTHTTSRLAFPLVMGVAY